MRGRQSCFVASEKLKPEKKRVKDDGAAKMPSPDMGHTLTVVHAHAKVLQQEVDVCSRLLLTTFTQQHQDASTGSHVLAHVTKL